MQIVVGISDARTSDNREDTLITYSLGSCIGVTVYDNLVGVGGMLHYQLPSSTLDAERAKEKPMMFADTGFALLLEKLQKMGASKRRLSVRVAGAAQMLGDQHVFDIGRRNHAAIRKLLWQHGLFLSGEHIGDNMPRTMQMNMADGNVTIRWNSQIVKL